MKPPATQGYIDYVGSRTVFSKYNCAKKLCNVLDPISQKVYYILWKVPPR